MGGSRLPHLKTVSRSVPYQVHPSDTSRRVATPPDMSKMCGEGWTAFARTPKSWIVVNSLSGLMTENEVAAAVLHMVHAFLFSAKVSALFVVVATPLCRMHSIRRLNLCSFQYCTRYTCRRKREARHDSCQNKCSSLPTFDPPIHLKFNPPQVNSIVAQDACIRRVLDSHTSGEGQVCLRH